MEKLKFSLPITLYGELEKFNDTISKCRCRIFYKYANRNGTYITDDFAEKLIASLPYTPTKGIYDTDTEDFGSHGEENDEGRIYGIVPENPNFAWEKHMDKDGVERLYACCDILVYTSLYKEAKSITEKAQSMELYPKTLTYHTEIINGSSYYVFDDGCLFGLQILGDRVEPCFEGARFYSLDEIQSFFQAAEKYEMEESIEMDVQKFKLSHNQIFEKIWDAINPNYNTEGRIEYWVNDVYDEFVITQSVSSDQLYKVNYTIEEDKVVLGESEEVFALIVNAKERDAIEGLRALNGGNFDAINENLANAEENLSKKIEYERLNSTLLTEKKEISDQYEEAQAQIQSLQNEVESYKLKEKEAVIEQYTSSLPQEVLEKYREKINDYDAHQLDMELAYELKNSNLSESFTLVPVEETNVDGVTAILTRIKNNRRN